MKISQRLLTYGCASTAVCLLVTSALAGQSASPVANRVTQAPDGKTRVTLTGNVHPLARAENSRGAVEDSLAMPRILLLLKRSDQQEAALQSLMEAQQDKSSPNYHAWLTPDQFGKQFGASDTDLQTVTDWLTAQGFQNLRVAAGRTVIEFSASAGQVMQVFGTQIQSYAVNGTLYVANSTDPQIPAALAPAVAGVVSLHNFPKKSHARFLGDVRMNATSHKLQPLFTFPDPGGNGSFYGVGPGDFATIYITKPLIGSGNDGSGQTIAIVGETQINPRDVSDFRTMFGLTNNFSAANIILNGMDPGITSLDEESESDLDVQWSGAVAPGATVKFVVSAGTTASSGIDLSALYIVEHDLADVLSESYGACESDLGSAGNAFFNRLWEQAAAQGITVVVSSGDGGSAGCDDFNTETVATRGLAVSGIAGTPFNVSVGGTDFNQFNSQTTYWNTTNDTVTGTSAKGYIPEFPWNENCSQLGLTGCGATAPQGSVNIVAGSGGASSVYAKPKWQMGVAGMPNDNHRDQPDVSLFASPGFEASGYLFCQTDLTGVSSCNLNEAEYTFHIIGGTSASAPAFAGLMALVNQYAAAHGGSSRQGNANNILYALAKKSGSSCTSSVTEAAGCVFNDVAAPNIHHPSGAASNSVACKGGTLNCSATVASGTGVLVDPAHTTTEAWTAGAGYDLATGLGSLNANNLAVAWGSASTIGTTTTLSLSPTTGITHGQNENVAVTVNVKASTGTGIPSGDVALLATLADGSTLGIDQFTLSNGAVTSTKTQNLPGGTYKVYAHYTGDGTNASSDSPSVQVTVGKENSKTFVNLVIYDVNGNPTDFTSTSSTYGAGFSILRVDVGDSAATVSPSTGISSGCSNGITNCPSGEVSLIPSGTPLAILGVSLNNLGYAVYQPLAPGNYGFSASYPGDSSYAPSGTNSNFVIAKAPTMAFAAVAGSPVQYGASSQIVVTLNTTSTGVAPTGTFQFYVDGAPIGGAVPVYESNHYFPGGSPPNYAWADGSSSTAFQSVGSHTLSAAYSGDTNYAGTTSATSAVTVTKYLPFIGSFGASPAVTLVNQPVTLFVQMYGSISVPTGMFTFYVDNQAVTGNVTLTPTGNSGVYASIPYTPVIPGSHSLTANYLGDSNYLSTSTPTAANLTVTGPDFTLTPTINSATVNAGSPATYTTMVGGTNGFTGTVNITCSLAAASAGCGANPASVAAGTSTIITVTTSMHQPALAFLLTKKRYADSPVFLLSLLALSAMFLLAFVRMSRKHPDSARVLTLEGTLLLVLFAAGCGGGTSSVTGPPPVFGTQTGTYTVTITATSGLITHSTTVSLTVK